MARTNIPRFLTMVRDMLLYLNRNQTTMIRNGNLDDEQQEALGDLVLALNRVYHLLTRNALPPKAPAPRRKVDLWAVDTRALYEAQEGLCYYCKAKLFPYGIWSKSVRRPGERRYQVEHALPVSRGGTDAPENLRIACEDCNRDKGTLTEEEFFAVLAMRDRNDN
jgi:hypothetical protein